MQMYFLNAIEKFRMIIKVYMFFQGITFQLNSNYILINEWKRSMNKSRLIGFSDRYIFKYMILLF